MNERPSTGATAIAPHAARASGRPTGDVIYRACIMACALVVPALLLALAIVIVRAAWPAISTVGSSLVFSTDWDVAHRKFGALSALAGTLLSSLLALAIATPLALGAAILSAELAPAWLRAPVAFL